MPVLYTGPRIAASFGVTYMVEKYHLPILYDEYRQRCASERAERVEYRKLNRVHKVCEQARIFLERDIYPSQPRLLRTSLIFATDLTRRDVRSALTKFMLEYGWRPGGVRL